jgi:hypothetical protein
VQINDNKTEQLKEKEKAKSRTKGKGVWIAQEPDFNSAIER